jgi:hypothetical protein
MNDPANCGRCGDACDDREYCVGGDCVCRPGLVRCGVYACIDPATYVHDCGTCSNDCGYTASTPYCAGGECTATPCDAADPRADFCDGNSCVPFSAMPTHPLHCGGCNNHCEYDEVCARGRCERFTMGRGCTSCPCPDCDGRTCCVYPGTTDLVVCLASGTSCP